MFYSVCLATSHRAFLSYEVAPVQAAKLMKEVDQAWKRLEARLGNLMCMDALVRILAPAWEDVACLQSPLAHWQAVP